MNRASAPSLSKTRHDPPQAQRPASHALTALAKAEKRHAAAAKAITELRKKVKGYERRLPPERLAEIHTGTATAKEAERMRKERWKDAERTLKAAATVAGEHAIVDTLRTKGKVARRYGMAVMMPDRQCLVWDFRDGFKTGKWEDRENRKALTIPASGTKPLQYLQRVTFYDPHSQAAE